MHKFLLTASIFAFTIGSVFGTGNQNIEYYKSDFRDTSPARPLGDWICVGSGKMAQDIKIGSTDNDLRAYFPQGSSAFVPIDFNQYGIIYCSNSSTIEGGAANEWLISPPIDLTNTPDKIMLAFDVLAFGSDTEPKFEVLATSAGSIPEDFNSPALYTGRSANSIQSPVVKRVYKAVSGISSPETRLAFVNKSRNAQILGFYNIELAEYAIDVSNSAESHLSTPTDVSINVEIGLQTPIPCEGFTAVLTCNGEEQTFSSNKQLGTTYTITKVSFPNPISIDYNQNLTYTITITPNYEGATPAVYSYDISCSEGYESTCVVEEGTATWCGWCIRGIAAFKHFSHDYADRFIGIAVHGSQDPMYQEHYVSNLKTYCGITGFPMATFNRSYTGNPYDRNAVEDILTKRTGYNVDIKKVEFGETTDHKVTVTYAPKLAFDTKHADLTAAVVITEDNVSGKAISWNQTNYYSGYTREQIENSIGEGAWTYFKPYCELPDNIPFIYMTYNHVAMGIYNSFNGGGNGATLPKEWEKDVEQEFSISFDMPFQTAPNEGGVQNWRNTHIIVLLIDNVSGQILNAAELGAGDYQTSGVNQISSVTTTDVCLKGDVLIVDVKGKASLSVHNTYGFCLYSSEIFDHAEIDTSSFSGPVVVRVTNGNHSYIKKFIF